MKFDFKDLMAFGMNKIINKNWNNFPEQFETLVMAEAMEIRRKTMAIRDGNNKFSAKNVVR